MLTGRSPPNLSNLVTATADLTSRQVLCLSNSLRYEVPRTKLKLGEKALTFAGPSARNSLLADLQRQSDTKTFEISSQTSLIVSALN
jgi:hypothetical protein